MNKNFDPDLYYFKDELEVRNGLLNSLSDKEIICTTKEINQFMDLFKKRE